tara:strand:+ start:218 stop:565 length:348 start_codon:yes stop_codon:yes gene_type:complete
MIDINITGFLLGLLILLGSIFLFLKYTYGEDYGEIDYKNLMQSNLKLPQDNSYKLTTNSGKDMLSKQCSNHIFSTETLSNNLTCKNLEKLINEEGTKYRDDSNYNIFKAEPSKYN